MMEAMVFLCLTTSLLMFNSSSASDWEEMPRP